MITKKMLSTVKVSNNTRIVVVGASDTGISFIESLLILKEINFTHITLLAPGGLTTMHINKRKQTGQQCLHICTNTFRRTHLLNALSVWDSTREGSSEDLRR